MGMLYNAYREGTPLLVTAGQQDRRLKFEEPILWGDMVAVVRPWTKWAVEVDRLEDLPHAVRRAVQTALTPPTGPVFLSLPMDVQMEVGRARSDACRSRSISRVRPPLAALRTRPQVLAEAQTRRSWSAAACTKPMPWPNWWQLAERLGAPVISEPGTTHGRLGFPADHPLYAPNMPLWAPEIRHATGGVRRAARRRHGPAAAVRLLRAPTGHSRAHAARAPRRGRRWQIGKNYPVEVGVLGDAKAGLAELDTMLRRE